MRVAMRRGIVCGFFLVGLILLGGQSVLFGQKGKQPAPTGEDAKHEPKNAVANLDVHPELQATLFASEPMLTNPTNLDVDHRGRVWICDVKNYRGNNGKRPEGDRILILEDTNGDGVADNVKTFYQGRDIDSAMGICVLGNKVIVSASPNVFVFTFDENDKVISKELLFTKTGQAQHDHSAHSFLFGPDGRLYWNFGNTGGKVCDKAGNVVIDKAGNQVVDNGKPYFGGMVFRCDMDGKNFETLGHNFRNNYEVTIDSFGTLWQSDNDDDGNKGVRINYVMEYGNYGYRDEINGSGWNTKRTNIEPETPLKHWHLNDPGVVPNLLQTGAGSPTGICVNEGSLLPKALQNQVIHCDAGPSIVRAYPVTVDGAGYKATVVNILDGSKKNNWFRPADACVAPDGSVFVTDWYDPGVGGHGQRDLDRGRIFRVAPPGAKYDVPKFDLKTIAGCIEAMKNPNLAVRYLAFTELRKQGAKAEPELLKLYQSKVPHERARALWLLGHLEGKSAEYVEKATRDEDPNIRIVGVRLARMTGYDPITLVGNLVNDPSSAVRRECAIALHLSPSPDMPKLWARLAQKHDGEDRWYLEALGIGAEKKWDECLAAFTEQQPSAPWFGKKWRDVVWRSRAKQTPDLLKLVIVNGKTEDLSRFFRAFDFLPASPEKEQALLALAFGNFEGDKAKLIATESLARLQNLNLKAIPKYAEAINKVLDLNKGTPLYVEMVARFGITDRYPELLALLQKSPNDQIGVDAARLLLDRDQFELLRNGAQVKDLPLALNTITAIGNASHGKAGMVLIPLLKDAKADAELRRQAVRALARAKPGAQQLVALAQKKELGKDLIPAASSALHQTAFKEIKVDADKLFPQPASKDNKPVPAISDLVKLKGSPVRGKELFVKAGTCANCHVVHKEGKEVGPNLSEIGKKLAREAMFETVLYPSASISHNFETYVCETAKGEVITGVLVSQTPDEVVLKEANALTRTIRRGEIESLNRSPISLMPADLTKALTAQDLADVVEYLMTLK